MCCEAMSLTASRGGKRSAIRMMALVVCVLFIAVMLVSSAYILTHANHIHDHDGPGGSCATCIHLQAAENILKQLSTAVVAAAIAFGGVLGIFSFLKAITPLFVSLTLVTLKVRLNN